MGKSDMHCHCGMPNGLGCSEEFEYEALEPMAKTAADMVDIMKEHGVDLQKEEDEGVKTLLVDLCKVTGGDSAAAIRTLIFPPPEDVRLKAREKIFKVLGAVFEKIAKAYKNDRAGTPIGFRAMEVAGDYEVN